MITLPITYKDLDDNEQTEEFEFHISREELLELESRHPHGLEEWLKRVTKAEDSREAYSEFKHIVLKAYGERSPDRKRFIKNDELRESFATHCAFDQLMFDIFTKEGFLEKFMAGVVPKVPQDQDKPAGPPATTATQ